MNFPPTKKTSHRDTLHGTVVDDPYRWLEDHQSRETQDWIESQNRYTETFFEKSSNRAKTLKRLKELFCFDRIVSPVKRGQRLFYAKKSGLETQFSLYMNDITTGKEQLLVDPKPLSTDGSIAIAAFTPSPSGKLLAHGLTRSGSDWQEWRFLDTEDRSYYHEVIQWVKFSVFSWAPRENGVYYARYGKPTCDSFDTKNEGQMLYHHRFGTSQDDDELIYARPDHKDWKFFGRTSHEGRYLVVVIDRPEDDKNMVLVKNLQVDTAPFVELIADFLGHYVLVSSYQDTLWFRTNHNSPNGRVVKADFSRPIPRFDEVIPETDFPLDRVSVYEDQIIATYVQDARTRAVVYNHAGKEMSEIELPMIGTAYGFEGGYLDKQSYYFFSGFTQPGCVYRYEHKTQSSTTFHKPSLEFEPDRFVTRQIFYKSRDGTPIPMFLVHKRNLERNGKNPTLLHGYGGFQLSMTPFFDPAMIYWLELGGVMAVANLRGGGEYGEGWWQEGIRHKRQNVFDDFIAASEWLVENGFCSSDNLAIAGRSNGGLLVGAAMTQRPDLFAVALPTVGVFDMLRFHKFTIGWAWVSDYGDPENANDFKYLLQYSPLHIIKPGVRYPATLIAVAEGDDRVVPCHSYKYAATLQAAQAGENPVLIRIQEKTGHGAGKPTQLVIDEALDKFDFLMQCLKIEHNCP